MTNLILIGFMGTGKTTIGEALSIKISWSFVDLDEEIQKEVGMEIPQIFSLYGEDFFREEEKKVLYRVLTKDHQVVATGGGVVLKEENRALIEKKGIPILLHAPIPIIMERLKETNRPLLQVNNPYLQIKRLLKEREESYRFTNLSINTAEGTIVEIVDEIIEMVGEVLGRDLC